MVFKFEYIVSDSYVTKKQELPTNQQIYVCLESKNSIGPSKLLCNCKPFSNLCYGQINRKDQKTNRVIAKCNVITNRMQQLMNYLMCIIDKLHVYSYVHKSLQVQRADRLFSLSSLPVSPFCEHALVLVLPLLVNRDVLQL